MTSTVSRDGSPPPSYESSVRVVITNNDTIAVPEEYLQELYNMVDALEASHGMAVMVNCFLMFWLVIIAFTFMYEWSEYLRKCG